MNERDIQQIVREKGMCGRLFGIGSTERSICIRERGHDGGVHDQGWTVSRRTVTDPSRDSRDADHFVFDVKEGVPQGFRKVFTTSDEEHAKWLASTLTRLDL